MSAPEQGTVRMNCNESGSKVWCRWNFDSQQAKAFGKLYRSFNRKTAAAMFSGLKQEPFPSLALPCFGSKTAEIQFLLL
jgi:hypothetical protein